MAAPMFSDASTLIASSTLCSGRTDTTRAGLAFSSSATVFIAPPFAIPGNPCVVVVLPLHVRVVRPAAPFGRHPDDVLPRVLDVARLAVHAVLGVDLQALAGGFV